MRKITFTFIGLFLGLLSLQGNQIQNATTTNQGFNYRYSQPIKFETRGIQFFVFPDGTFDFTRAGRHYTSRFGRSNRPGRIRYVNNSYAPFVHGRAVVRNRYGDIIRIGRTPVLYDYQRRVRRIGPVTMSYGRFGLLRRIGDMQVRFNPRGKLVFARGHVLHDYCGICGIHGCTMEHFNQRDYAKWNNHKWDKFQKHSDWDDDDWDDDDWDDDDWDDDDKKYKRKKRKRYDYHDD